jgi:CRISPR-associated protein Csd1
MIIQSLTALYDRLAASEDPEQRLPEPGWKENEIAFVIDLDADGIPVNVVALRQPQEKGRPRAPRRVVPQEATRTGKISDIPSEKDCWKASLFWDNPRYALGLASGDDAKSRREAEVSHGLFKLRHEKFAREAGDAVTADDGMRAILNFLTRGAAKSLEHGDPSWLKDIQGSGGNVAFRLDGDFDLICRRPSIRTAISAGAMAELDGNEGSGLVGQCLVTGHVTRIKRIHPPIQGVLGAQTSGASIVSFNLPSFESYGLSQGENAPVGAYAAFAYTTALNTLLRQGSASRARAGATTIVFWAGRETPNEAALNSALAAVAEDDPWRDGEVLNRLYKSPLDGQPAPLDDPTPFFILGLSAESKSRLTIRFFHAGTIAEAGGIIARWFEELAIVPDDGPPLSMTRLRRALSVRGDLKNTPPLLEAELLCAAYTGTPLPQRVLAEALVRCAAERGPTREQAALMKAFLIRNQGRKVTMGLDPDEPDQAYRLGRLLAVLEWVQERATGAKAGIAERYWGSASTTPAFVFPELLKLAIFHLAKLDTMPPPWPGFATNRRKDIEAIVDGLPPLLRHRLELIDQGSFAIGYWHQHAARKSGTETSTGNDIAEENAA